jgi:pimeloyl-ACP methyl ester carboxylesterase
MPDVTVNGVRLFYQQYGEGPDVVLVHAVTSNQAVWVFSGLPDAIAAAGFRVTTYDLRGHGMSERPPTGYTSAAMADEFRALHATLSLKPALLVGHSFGGSVAGLMGQPRRTNLGLTYGNAGSALFHPAWTVWSQLGAVGGVIITAAMLVYFVVFFATLLGAKEREPAVSLPTSEPYHDEDVAAVHDFTPWVVAAIVLLVIAYAPPLYEVVTGPAQAVPGYDPASPVAIGR